MVKRKRTKGQTYARIDTLATSLKVRVKRQSRKSQTIHDDRHTTPWEFKKTAYYANYEPWESISNIRRV
jgi:hypothetical protein